MTKAELIELIRGRVSGGDTSGDKLGAVHRKRIEYCIGRAFNQIIYELFRQDPSNLDLFCKTYDSLVMAKDGTTDIYYTTLPAQIVQLPNVADGVRRIWVEGDTDISFAPLDADAWALVDGLEVGNASINPVVGYTVKNGRIEYADLAVGDAIVGQTLNMDIVIPFEAYESTDTVYVPAGQDETLVRMTTEFLLNQPPQDIISDNN